MSDEDARPAMFAPEAGIGVPLAVAGFGFAVLVLGMANARVFSPAAIGLFVPVAMATGGFCLLIGGLFEFRANNTFGGTFAVLYAGFLLTTGLILRWFAGDITTVAGALAFGDAFGTWLLLWGVFTVLLSVGAWYINMPAFLAFALLAAGLLRARVREHHEPERHRDVPDQARRLGADHRRRLRLVSELGGIAQLARPGQAPAVAVPVLARGGAAPTSTPAVHA